MTEQELFDRVAVHLLTQRATARSTTNPGACLYHAPDGKKCAIGVLIPDELYDFRFENRTVDALPVDVLEKLGLVGKIGLALALQNVHDQCDVDNWVAYLDVVAEDHDLSPAVLTPFAPTSARSGP